MSAVAVDHLALILERKARENARRRRHVHALELTGEDRGARAIAALRRPAGAPPRILAEIKHASPSAGVLRPRAPGGVAAIARAYEEAGAAAISVLADAPGFLGTPLDVRRAVRAVSVPVLFKEFVLDEAQIALARAMGASMVLLLVRALDDARLAALVGAAHAAGLAPVVEAADAEELARALRTGASIVGVNARDLRSFSLDPERAAAALREVPEDRVAVYMSGVESPEGLARVAGGRADAVLVGTSLMRAPSPGAQLRALLMEGG